MEMARPLKPNRLRKLDRHCGAFTEGANENQLLCDPSLVQGAPRSERLREHCVRHVQSSRNRAFVFLFACFTNIDDRHIKSVDGLSELCRCYRPAAARNLSLR
jgi:hypothetical protein